MTTTAWGRKYFSPESCPSEQTIRRWLRAGTLPGRKVGGTWYVDDHAWLADGDELVLRVLASGSQEISYTRPRHRPIPRLRGRGHD